MLNITNQEFRQLSEFIRKHYGIYLKEEKRALVIGRLHHVLASKNFRTFKQYYDYIVADRTGEAVMTLVNKITTNHTYFMREAEHFRYFRSQVLPSLAATVKDRDLRIWSAGCSSGEEPYTLAMLIDDYFGFQKSQWDTKVLATDISGHILEKAKQGIYSYEEISVLPEPWQKKHFKKYDHEHAAVSDPIKNEVIFRKFNLMEAVFPFKRKFHVIFCRNVMIYFDHSTKQELVHKFYELLEPGGYLFIGHSESFQRESSPFQYLLPAVYRKE